MIDAHRRRVWKTALGECLIHPVSLSYIPGLSYGDPTRHYCGHAVGARGSGGAYTVLSSKISKPIMSTRRDRPSFSGKMFPPSFLPVTGVRFVFFRKSNDLASYKIGFFHVIFALALSLDLLPIRCGVTGERISHHHRI